MITSSETPFHRLILSLSQTLDYVHPDIADHQQRVTYIAVNMARQMGYPKDCMVDIFNASALHDIGLIKTESRVSALKLGQLDQMQWHCNMGFTLLKKIPIFKRAAEMILYHHTPWNAGEFPNNFATFLSSNIIHLADTVERMIDRKLDVLSQANLIRQEITRQSGKWFNPDCVDSFNKVSELESFWLDCISDRIYSVLLDQIDWPILTVNDSMVKTIAKMFAGIVDATSHWTATHSMGVAITATELAKRFCFSPRETHLIQIAGYLHDIGKLTVPSSILEKPAKLTESERNIVKRHSYHTFRVLKTIGGMPQVCEWAAFHHERLDGKGYPFHHKAENLTLGSRIMAAADVFTAVTEDRPYRKGMTKEQTISLLDKSVEDGSLDGEIVSIIKGEYEGLNQIRLENESGYLENQKQLAEIVNPTTAIMS